MTQGEVLYLSLEDSYRRIQSRLFDLTEDAPPTLHFAIMADTLKHGLEQQIEQFLTEHPTTKLVVIDTLQRVRSAGSDSNLYANDYQDVSLLKQLADKHHIAVLLIHHLRKLHDDDPMNMISGSTGLSLSLIHIYLSPLKKPHRCGFSAYANNFRQAPRTSVSSTCG